MRGRILFFAWLLAANATDGLFAQPHSQAGTRQENALTVRVGELAGIHEYSPEAWGMVGIEAVNRRQQDVEALAALSFPGEASLQYARLLWVPPGAIRHSWCPVYPPKTFSPTKSPAQVRTLIIDRTAGRETVVTGFGGRVMTPTLVPIHRGVQVTGMIADPEPVDGQDMAYEAVIAGRSAAQLSRRVQQVGDEFLPPIVETLQGLDHLVLTNDRLAHDAAGMTAVRRWLHRGGSIWVMLDRASASTASALLGEALDLQVVDRVGLTEVQIDSVGNEDARAAAPRQFEEPVDLVRVLVEGVAVMHRVNGWPASFWKRSGKGRVFFTTLGPQGWVRRRTSADQRPRNPLDDTAYVVLPPLADFATLFFRESRPLTIKPEKFEPYLAEQIGYRIVSRRQVALVLGLFCVGVPLMGIYLRRRGRSEILAPGAFAAALLAAGGLVAMGALSRGAMEPTVAVAQFAEAAAGAEDVSMTGLAAIYNPQASAAPIGAMRGGILIPDRTGLSGETHRMVWTGLDEWHWENLTLPSGVRLASFRFGAKIDQPLFAQATFGPQGLIGTFSSGPFQADGDAVIAVPIGPALAPKLNEEGGFRAGAGDTLAPGQFVAGGLLSDEQGRRQAVYQQLFRPRKGQPPYPRRPTLFFWSRPLAAPFKFAENGLRRPGRPLVGTGARGTLVGSSLVAIPLEIQRPQPGAEVSIPASFMRCRAIKGPQGISSLFNHRTGQWSSYGRRSQVWLGFELPKAVRPLQVEQATLEVHINAPAWTLQVSRWQQGRMQLAASRSNPLGKLRFNLADDGEFQPDSDGKFKVELDMAPSEPRPQAGARERIEWKIDYVRLEVTGTTLEP